MPWPPAMVKSCNWHSPPSSQTGQSWGWLIISHSMTDLRRAMASGSVVDTTMPSWAGSMQDICSPLTGPSSIFTAHTRQAPALPRAGCQQKCGMTIPIWRAASRTLVSSGTSTSMLSMISFGICLFDPVRNLSAVDPVGNDPHHLVLHAEETMGTQVVARFRPGGRTAVDLDKVHG